jgi:nicotinate dehydrogenase subunit A
MAARSITLNVNGSPRTTQADESTPLLYVLRHDFDLKGTRFGCGAAQCGSCQVLVDGLGVPACDTPLWAVENKTVVTVEGLADGDCPHPLQQAFIDEQAAQCGYCISGILISAVALLKNNPQPTETQVRQTLDKHLCRCGSHNRIVRAVLRAAGVMAATGAAS